MSLTGLIRGLLVVIVGAEGSPAAQVAEPATDTTPVPPVVPTDTTPVPLILPAVPAPLVTPDGHPEDTAEPAPGKPVRRPVAWPVVLMALGAFIAVLDMPVTPAELAELAAELPADVHLTDVEQDGDSIRAMRLNSV